MENLGMVAGLLTLLFTVLSAIGGLKWKKYKNLFIETAEAVYTIAEAVKDDKVSQEELEKIVKEITDVIDAWTD
jgi:hypothetical protein